MADLHDLTALEQAAAIRAGETTSLELTEHYLARTDRHEKLWTYQELPSLQTYLLVEQDAPRVELYRRANDWQVEYVEQGDLWLDCLDMALPLADIYAAVQWPAPTPPRSPW